MSTILKALKKLEQEKDSFQEGRNSSDYMGPGSSYVQPPRGFRRIAGPLRRHILMLLIILSLGGAAVHYYGQARVPSAPIPDTALNSEPIVSSPPSKAQSSAPIKPQAAASEPVPVPSKKLSLPKDDEPRKSSPAPNAPPTEASLDKTPAKALAADKSRIVGQPKPKSMKWLANRESTPPGEIIVTRPSSDAPATSITNKQSGEIASRGNTSAPPPAPPSERITAPRSPSSQEDYQDVAPLNDGRLKVQAIAWSSVVEDRMAVINTRILHEGDKVDGFLVLAIRRDDVVVRESGTLYRVLFGRP